jgi:ribosomal protein S18 acetylase RimI-like enzyme
MRQTLEPLNKPANASAFLLRDLEPGDLEWVVQQHAQIYAQEYGFNAEFEVFVASICADFVQHFQPGWERAWMATHHGERAGSVFVVKKSSSTAQLRMLILSREARGLGLGARLTDEAIRFSRERGYAEMVLWTNAHLLAARAIYQKRGFQLIETQVSQSFGQTTVGETWRLRL